jgi:hypothetical protein
MYIVKHNYISWWYVYYTNAQLHVSAINVGHLQVVHENLSIGCTKLCGEFIGCRWGVVGATRSRTYQSPLQPINSQHTLV